VVPIMSAYGSPSPSPSAYSTYGSPSPSAYGSYAQARSPQSPYGQAQSKDPPEARLRALLRKAFLDVEKALLDWDEASSQAMEVLRALVNAGDRLRDFTAAEGQLGVLSRIKGAEHELRSRLMRSMERLHRALLPQVAALATVCEKVDKVVDSTLQQSLDLQAQCDPASLWDGSYDGQPSIAEMQEWLQDCFISLGRELALRELLMRDVGSDEGMNRAVEHWDSRIWFDPEQTRARLDAVRIHGT
jgi:hypothetical protein